MPLIFYAKFECGCMHILCFQPEDSDISDDEEETSTSVTASVIYASPDKTSSPKSHELKAHLSPSRMQDLKADEEDEHGYTWGE